MMEYPEYLIPKHYWKASIPPEEVCQKVSDIAIARRFDMAAPNCIQTLLDGTINILHDVMYPGQLNDLSTNLLGAGFRIPDCGIRQVGKGQDDWKDYEVIDPAEETEHFIPIENDWTAAGWLVKDLHEEDFPYQRFFNTKKECKEWTDKINEAKKKGLSNRADVPLWNDLPKASKSKSEEGEDEQIPYIDTYFRCIVRHAPTRLNYWHYTLHFYPEETPDKENKGSKGWRELALTAVWDAIRKTAYHFTSDADYAQWPTWQTDVIDPSRVPSQS